VVLGGPVKTDPAENIAASFHVSVTVTYKACGEVFDGKE
jgi:hypothetical protein